jgi:hypothetical protein
MGMSPDLSVATAAPKHTRLEGARLGEEMKEFRAMADNGVSSSHIGRRGDVAFT